MPLESMNLYPVRSAHRVVSTDSLIMPIVSGREKELARTYIFFRTFTSKSINFRREIPLCSFFWKQATSSGDETFQVEIRNKIYLLLLLQERSNGFSLRNTIRTLAEVNLATLSYPFSFAGKT